MGDIHRPQRSTTIMFSASWASPSLVKMVRIGVASFWKYAVIKVRLIANSQAAVDQLIPWLLDENRQLRGIAFSKVIFDTTGKRVLSVNPKNETDQRVTASAYSVSSVSRTRVVDQGGV